MFPLKIIHHGWFRDNVVTEAGELVMAQYTKEIEAEMATAVKWLADRGGSGVQDRYGHVVARGDTARHIPALTWFRCVFSAEDHPSHLTPVNGRIWTPEAVEKVRDKLAAVDFVGGIS